MSKPLTGWRLLIVSIALFVPLIAFIITRAVKSTKFDNRVDAHMQAAFADTQNIEKDIDYVVVQSDIARTALEDKGLTKGYTSLFTTTKEDDLAWYYYDVVRRNNYFHRLKLIRDTQDQTFTTSQLKDFAEYAEMRNLIHQSAAETYKVPDGISIYPYNMLFFLWALVSAISAAFGIMGIFTVIDEG